jgi:hypothetical protein
MRQGGQWRANHTRIDAHFHTPEAAFRQPDGVADPPFGQLRDLSSFAVSTKVPGRLPVRPCRPALRRFRRAVRVTVWSP